MNVAAVQSFDFESVPVRMILCGDSPWWVAADLARAMGVKNSRHLAARVDEQDRATINMAERTPNIRPAYAKRTLSEPIESEEGPSRDMWIVNESGLYTILLRSDAAMQPGTVAYRFRRWVTAEVLPAIRKNGSYGVKPLSGSRRDRLWSEHRAVLDRFLAAANPLARRFAHIRLCELSDELGIESPPAMPDESAEAARVEQFWMLADAAMAAGLLENHHRRPALLAFRGGDLETAFSKLKASIRIDAGLRAALAFGPRPLIAIKPINSRITRGAVHCMVFQAMPLPAPEAQLMLH